MDLTQDAILSMLIKEGGKVKNSDILSKFRSLLNSTDPVEKKQNRDLFKTFVNNVAVVKELEDGRYLFLKKRYHHLLNTENEDSDKEPFKAENGPCSKDAAETLDKVQERSSLFQDGDNVSDRAGAEDVDSHITGNISPCRVDEHSLIQLALQRSKTVDIKPRKCISFVQNQVISLNDSAEGETFFPGQTGTANTNKPCALPLRMPATRTTTESQCTRFTEDTTSQEGTADSVPNTPQNKRRPCAEGAVLSSPLLRRGCKSARPAEEPKHSELVPLEQNEHEWLVKSAAGQWDQVYGLLLQDAHLAEKRDFMSGFTALHWAAKCGNSNMVTKIVEASRKVGSGIDINAKTHGGYTPLHIAAIHDQEFIMTQLVQDYEADIRIRDNCGKRSYYYLHKGVSSTVREMLGEPKTLQQVVLAPEREEAELPKGPSTLTRLFQEAELHVGHSTLTRLFQPHTIGPKKSKSKHREWFYSVSEEPQEE